MLSNMGLVELDANDGEISIDNIITIKEEEEMDPVIKDEIEIEETSITNTYNLNNNQRCVPVVYTTRLDDMQILKKDLECFTVDDIVENIILESKPSLTQLFKQPIKPIVKFDDAFAQLCEKIRQVNELTTPQNDSDIPIVFDETMFLETIDISESSAEEYEDIIPLNFLSTTNRGYGVKNKKRGKSGRPGKRGRPRKGESSGHMRARDNLNENITTFNQQLDMNLQPIRCKPCTIKLVPTNMVVFINEQMHLIYDREKDNIWLEGVHYKIVMNSGILLRDLSNKTVDFYGFDEKFLHTKTIDSLDCKRLSKMHWSHKWRHNVLYANLCCWFHRQRVVDSLIWCGIPHRINPKIFRKEHLCPPKQCDCCCKNIYIQYNDVNKSGTTLLCTPMFEVTSETISSDGLRIQTNLMARDENSDETLFSRVSKLDSTGSSEKSSKFPNGSSTKSINILTSSSVKSNVTVMRSFEEPVETNHREFLNSNTTALAAVDSTLGVIISKDYSEMKEFYEIKSNRRVVKHVQSNLQYSNIENFFKKGIRLNADCNKIFCCWHKQDEMLKCFEFKHVPMITQFIRTPHPCPPDRCICCCKPNPKTLLTSTLKEKLEQIKSKNYISEHAQNYKSIVKQRRQFVAKSKNEYKHDLLKLPQYDLKNKQRVQPASTLENIWPPTQLASEKLYNSSFAKNKDHTQREVIANISVNTRKQIGSNVNPAPTIPKLMQQPAATMQPQRIPIWPRPIPLARPTQIQTLPPPQISNSASGSVLEANTSLLSNITTAQSKITLPGNSLASAPNALSNTSFVDTVQDDTVISLVNNILNRFQDVRLIITPDGNVSAELNRPMESWTCEELKILSQILTHAKNQVKALKDAGHLNVATNTVLNPFPTNVNSNTNKNSVPSAVTMPLINTAVTTQNAARPPSNTHLGLTAHCATTPVSNTTPILTQTTPAKSLNPQFTKVPMPIGYTESTLPQNTVIPSRTAKTDTHIEAPSTQNPGTSSIASAKNMNNKENLDNGFSRADAFKCYTNLSALKMQEYLKSCRSYLNNIKFAPKIQDVFSIKEMSGVIPNAKNKTQLTQSLNVTKRNTTLTAKNTPKTQNIPKSQNTTNLPNNRPKEVDQQTQTEPTKKYAVKRKQKQKPGGDTKKPKTASSNKKNSNETKGMITTQIDLTDSDVEENSFATLTPSMPPVLCPMPSISSLASKPTEITSAVTTVTDRTTSDVKDNLTAFALSPLEDPPTPSISPGNAPILSNALTRTPQITNEVFNPNPVYMPLPPGLLPTLPEVQIPPVITMQISGEYEPNDDDCILGV